MAIKTFPRADNIEPVTVEEAQVLFPGSFRKRMYWFCLGVDHNGILWAWTGKGFGEYGAARYWDGEKWQ